MLVVTAMRDGELAPAGRPPRALRCVKVQSARVQPMGDASKRHGAAVDLKCLNGHLLSWVGRVVVVVAVAVVVAVERSGG
jgi:hypothetical protein